MVISSEIKYISKPYINEPSYLKILVIYLVSPPPPPYITADTVRKYLEVVSTLICTRHQITSGGETETVLHSLNRI